MRTVAIMRGAASGEVTRTATAQVSSGQGGAHTVELIEYGGSWKIVLDVN